MKKHISLLILSFFFIAVLKAQERKKDTLFFSVDKYYTISPTIVSNLSGRTYPESIEFETEQRKHTKTNGYIFFVGDGYLTKGLKPKKILSIKDYIENREFYLDGKYNQIIDKWKLKDSLTDKYTIYFVNGNEFIQPRYLEYHSYYPIGKGENAITNKIKDTLFFKLDNDYVYASKISPESYLIEDSKGSEIIFLEKIKSIFGLKPKKVLQLKEFIRHSKFFDENKFVKLNYFGLYQYLKNYELFLIKNDNEFINVNTTTVIYD
jgi:hypothetical protein